MYTYTRHTHKCKVNICKLCNGVQRKEKKRARHTNKTPGKKRKGFFLNKARSIHSHNKKWCVFFVLFWGGGQKQQQQVWTEEREGKNKKGRGERGELHGSRDTRRRSTTALYVNQYL